MDEVTVSGMTEWDSVKSGNQPEDQWFTREEIGCGSVMRDFRCNSLVLCYDPVSSLRKRNDVQGKGWLDFNSLGLTNRLARADTEGDVSRTRMSGFEG